MKGRHLAIEEDMVLELREVAELSDEELTLLIEDLAALLISRWYCHEENKSANEVPFQNNRFDF